MAHVEKYSFYKIIAFQFYIQNDAIYEIINLWYNRQWLVCIIVVLILLEEMINIHLVINTIISIITATIGIATNFLIVFV